MALNHIRKLLVLLPLLALPVQANEVPQAIDGHTVYGPTEIKLREQAILKLPAGYAFVDQEKGAELMKRMGNQTDGRFLGLVLPQDEKAKWMVVAEYEASGYIKDDDAKDWDADDLLESLKEGTEAGNEVRRQQQIPEFEVSGWLEKPSYQAASHQLVWAALTHEKAAPVNQGIGVNYNTYALGREGYISLNLVTDAATVEADKPVAKTLLSALQFNDGKRYQDFNASTDHIAEYGLAALVAGAAAKKLGLLAMLGVFFAKFFKLIAVGAVALFALVRRMFSNGGTSSK